MTNNHSGYSGSCFPHRIRMEYFVTESVMDK